MCNKNSLNISIFKLFAVLLRQPQHWNFYFHFKLITKFSPEVPLKLKEKSQSRQLWLHDEPTAPTNELWRWLPSASSFTVIPPFRFWLQDESISPFDGLCRWIIFHSEFTLLSLVHFLFYKSLRCCHRKSRTVCWKLLWIVSCGCL